MAGKEEIDTSAKIHFDSAYDCMKEVVNGLRMIDGNVKIAALNPDGTNALSSVRLTSGMWAREKWNALDQGTRDAIIRNQNIVVTHIRLSENDSYLSAYNAMAEFKTKPELDSYEKKDRLFLARTRLMNEFPDYVAAYKKQYEAMMIHLRAIPLAVRLRPIQIEHYERVCGYLNKRHFYIDTSEPGAGKTHLTIKVAQQRGLKLLVYAPPSGLAVWDDASAYYGIEVLDLTSYQSLATRLNSQPKNGLLTRTEKEKGNPIYTPTDKLYDILKSGVIVVFDECQDLRNKNQYYEAAMAITRCIIRGIPDGKGGIRGTPSRFALTSGTPFSKEDNIVNMFRFTSVVTKKKLFNRKDREHGITEIIDYGKRYSPEATAKFLEENPFPGSIGQAKIFAVQFYVNVIAPFITSNMPKDRAFEECIKNAFYTLSSERQKELDIAMGQLNEKIKAAEAAGKRLFGYESELALIDNAKREVFASEALRILTEVQNSKVCVFTQHLDPLSFVKQFLETRGFKVLYIDGSVKPQQRGPIISKFQTDPAYRVLIGTCSTCEKSISLHDTVGNAPRYMFTSPNFNAQAVHQIARRIHRDGMKSPAITYMVYGGTTEKASQDRIQRILEERSDLMKLTLPQQVEAKVLFPSDYQAVHM